MSNCKKIVDLLSAYTYGDLSPEDMRRVRIHVGECQECARELAAITRVVSIIPDELPELSDEERQRMLWSVQGAIKAKQETKRFFLFTPAFVRSMAVAATVITAFGAGSIYGQLTKPAKIVKVTVVKEVPVHSNSPEKRMDLPGNAEKDQIAGTAGTEADLFNRSRWEIYRSSPSRNATGGADVETDTEISDPWTWQGGTLGSNSGYPSMPFDNTTGLTVPENTDASSKDQVATEGESGIAPEAQPKPEANPR